MKKICQTKHTICLIESTTNNSLYAMKVFPHKENLPSLAYKHEKSMIRYNHPNLIKIHKGKDFQKTNKGGQM